MKKDLSRIRARMLGLAQHSAMLAEVTGRMLDELMAVDASLPALGVGIVRRSHEAGALAGSIQEAFGDLTADVERVLAGESMRETVAALRRTADELERHGAPGLARSQRARADVLEARLEAGEVHQACPAAPETGPELDDDDPRPNSPEDVGYKAVGA